jgi:hypothetical protein
MPWSVSITRGLVILRPAEGGQRARPECVPGNLAVRGYGKIKQLERATSFAKDFMSAVATEAQKGGPDRLSSPAIGLFDRLDRDITRQLKVAPWTTGS